MSYDYMLFKLKQPISSHLEINETTVAPIGTYEEIKESLFRIFPEIEWNDQWRTGALNIEGRWFEFGIFEDEPVKTCISVRTSYRQDSTDIIEKLCRSLGWIGFDGQTLKLYGDYKYGV